VTEKKKKKKSKKSSEDPDKVIYCSWYDCRHSMLLLYRYLCFELLLTRPSIQRL
jgi:maltodextrin utilization protein YvdJ